MINFSATNFVNLRLPCRTKPTALDKERNFLLRIERPSAKKDISRDFPAGSRSGKQK